jgi:hypothetical protein
MTQEYIRYAKSFLLFHLMQLPLAVIPPAPRHTTAL